MHRSLKLTDSTVKVFNFLNTTTNFLHMRYLQVWIFPSCLRFFAVDDRAASSLPAGAWLSSWQCGWHQRVLCLFVLMCRYFYLLCLSMQIYSIVWLSEGIESSVRLSLWIHPVSSLVQVSPWRTWSPSHLEWRCPSERPSTAAASSPAPIGLRRSAC